MGNVIVTAGEKRMRKVRIPFYPVIIIPLLIMELSCYTQFATFEQQSVAPRTDTIKAADKETCIWERDLMGFPYLHCYPSYYPRQWYLYNYSPWWYHNDRHQYNADRCPPYYYYDPNCGCCRYYLNNPELSRASRGGSRGEPSHDAQVVNAAPQENNRVTVSSSSRTTIYAPLHGAPAPSNAVAAPAGGSSTPSTVSQTGSDSLAAKQQGDSVSVHDTIRPPPTPKRPQRSMRSR